MAKNFYAVRTGRTKGVFTSWDACKASVEGYAGAEYRGFNTEDEAYNYLNGNEMAVTNGVKVIIEKPKDEHTVNIYTDGSYKNGYVALGVFIEAKDRGFSFYGIVQCEEYQSIANIAGELLGVLVGVQLAKDMGFSNINIYHDLQGVSSWYDGTFTARGALQQLYVSLMNSLRLQYNLSYTFYKVKSHSGVNGNTIADRLAARASNYKAYIDLNQILHGVLTVRDVPLLR